MASEATNMQPTLYFSWVNSNKIKDHNIPTTLMEVYPDGFYCALCQWWSDGENGEWRIIPHGPKMAQPKKDENGEWLPFVEEILPPTPEDYKTIKK